MRLGLWLPACPSLTMPFVVVVVVVVVVKQDLTEGTLQKVCV